jgi:hypothetical protein
MFGMAARKKRPLRAALLAAAVAASCSTVTSGTPAASRTGAPGSPTAAVPGGPPAIAPPAAMSAEDQIRETRMAFQEAANSQTWDAYTELMCAGMWARFTGTVMDYVKKDRPQTGLTRITITSVTMLLKREDGWKVRVL